MNMETYDRTFHILLVEDNPSDVLLTQEAFKETKMPYALHVAKDGVEAMEFLHREGEYADAVRPDIILLDLNLPRKDGRQVLSEIRADEELKRIPVVILTTSQDHEDILRSYELHANCYICKPVDLNKFFRVVNSVENFWFGTVKLPPEG
ncbi:response regulator [Desulfobacterales bacterium HSG2]|nr:response regulator [Desulfobacterales bacterium HSG2]